MADERHPIQAGRTQQQWRAAYAEQQQIIKQQKATIRELEHGKALAEKAARDSWAFVRSLRGTPQKYSA